MIDPGLEKRVALVTGGNNPCGIGAATAIALAAQGVAVFIHYYRQPEPLSAEPADRPTEASTPGTAHYYAMQAKTADEVVAAIHRSQGRADSWEANLNDPTVVPELFNLVEDRFGPVDVLVNNAADFQADTFVPPTRSEDEGHEVWEEGPVSSPINAESHDRHFAVNSRAAALLTAEFARRYVRNEQQWGRIVNVSADCSWGSPYEVSYRASKHALESYSRSAAAELGPLGITVNIVSPGPIQTGYIAPEFERQLIAEIPLGRVGTPEDVADMIVFLASEQARWITGQLITVHGGHRMSFGL